MRTDTAQPIRLAEYQPPAFTIDAVRLDITLDPDRTEVAARLEVRRLDENADILVLDGEDLELLSVSVDGAPLAPDAYTLDEASLRIPGLGASAVVETRVVFSPRENTALSGIYLSNNRIFSQCEPEGFRRITYFTDRPDVLATYEVRLEGDKAAFPSLLSNGNRIDGGELEGGRHWALWRDPFPKPSYLFATVAGGFDLLEDSFTTQSGRDVALQIFSDPGDAPRVAYAMDALKRSMRWDETAFGREYDLDLFMIVAVRDFNFGAMENKGLNIFNSSLLLADPDSATDFDYERIESVVAHEYFHNWTGNRITCRDWFQLCLKEGLTVFRDQSFSADQRGAAIQRIKDVRRLRSVQFGEDGGPLAHPVRPSEYVKIDNFYTATVYEKGSELVRVLKELIGADAFRRGMDLYFEREDGKAATMEDFVACFAEASGQDLSSFLAWYGQAGTPHITASTTHDENGLTLTLRQTTPPTPKQDDKHPVALPVRMGLLDAEGTAVPLALDGDADAQPPLERTLVLDTAEQSWRFPKAPQNTTLSLLRGFSAPVKLTMDEPDSAIALRARADTDAFNQWEARQILARRAVLAQIAGDAPTANTAADAYVAAVAETLASDTEPGLQALALTPPDEAEISQLVEILDPEAVRDARRWLSSRIAAKTQHTLRTYVEAPTAPFSTDPASAALRARRNAALIRLADHDAAYTQAEAQEILAQADNLTDRMAALGALDIAGEPAALEAALSTFYDTWKDQPLIMDKWFSLQAQTRRSDAVARVRSLVQHSDYDRRTPNRVRAVVGAFGFANPSAFHTADGSGYAVFVDELIAQDTRNPVLAARMAGAFEVWPRLEPKRRVLAQAALERLRATEGLSGNTVEMVDRMLDAA